jgi:glycerophosphoryl diester phosphodiesterase
MKPLLIAHRGGVFPKTKENSLNSLYYSVKDSSDIIELDVCTNREGQFVLYHPKTPDSSQYINYKCGRFPLLRAALDIIQSKKWLYLDIKDPRINFQKLFKLLEAKHQNKIIIGSFMKEILTEAKDYPVDYLVYQCIPRKRSVNAARKVGADWVAPIPFRLTTKIIDHIHSNGLKFTPAGNENYAKQYRYFKLGAHALATYRVDKLRAYIEKRLLQKKN